MGAYAPRACVVCHELYRPTWYRQKTCSSKCCHQLRAGYRATEETREKIRAAIAARGSRVVIHSRICIICGATFEQPGEQHARKCCSKVCNSELRSRIQQARVSDEERERRRMADWLDRAERARLREARRAQQAAEYRERYPLFSIRCLQCGAEFIGGRKRKYCSRSCRRKGNHRAYSAARKAVVPKRITRGSCLDPFVIFRRDNWCCQLCGVRTPQKLRGTYEDRAPELDHIVPLARGGAHIESNLQCLCRRCNITKGSRVIGQLRLKL